MESASLTTIKNSLMEIDPGKLGAVAIIVVGTGFTLCKIVDTLTKQKCDFEISYKDVSLKVTSSSGVSA